MYDAIIIVGPTASGKTALSIELAKVLKTEIINADSMYIYKSLNIGTAKPTIDEMKGITHHLIDIVNPSEEMNVSIYREYAKNILKYFEKKKLLPIIVGGTGFYIDSYITNYSYGETTKDTNLRKLLSDEYDNLGSEILYKKLQQLDITSANKIHPNDKVRLIRALELCMSGDNKSSINNLDKPLIKNPLIIGLNINRDVLYDRINKRVDSMLSKGLLEEVSYLVNDLHLTPENHQSMKGIGYKEIYYYLKNEIDLGFAVEQIKQHTRNYAKRQLTWFRRNKNIIWIDGLDTTTNQVNKILNLYNLYN